jgi:AcrR family transcriptional regulator
MPRPPDPLRREQLLQEAVDYAIEQGLANLTLRPLAVALGVSPNSLVHHFGSKEKLLSLILNAVRDRLRSMYGEMHSESGGDPLQGLWGWTSSPERLPFFRSFFEAYGLALRQPQRYAPFLSRVVTDWLDTPSPAQTTLELALLRGLLLDLLTTGERERVDGALELYLARSRAGRV